MVKENRAIYLYVMLRKLHKIKVLSSVYLQQARGVTLFSNPIDDSISCPPQVIKRLTLHIHWCSAYKNKSVYMEMSQFV